MANMKRGGDFDSMDGGKRSRGGGKYAFDARVLIQSKVSLSTLEIVNYCVFIKDILKDNRFGHVLFRKS